VRRIVESHGGSVTVRSDACEGTRFSIGLPRIAVGRGEAGSDDGDRTAQREAVAAAG
jgi:signal transduction histidine kinase